MHHVLQALVRLVLPPLLALGAGLGFAQPIYRAKVIAPPEVCCDGIELFWYTAIDLNNSGKSLLHQYQYGAPGVSFVTYDRHGNFIEWLAGDTRYEGNRRVAINQWGDVVGSMTHSNFIWKGVVQMDQGFGASIHGFPDDEYGGFFSDAWAYGLSDEGHVVGQATSSVDGRHRGYLWRNEVMTEIGTFGGPTSAAVAVNNRGIAVGQADLADGRVHAFVYRQGKLRDLGTLGGANSWAGEINDRGRIVGTAELADGSSRAFVYDDRQMAALPTPEGASARAWSINRRGEVIGAYTLAGQTHAFLFDGVAVHRLNDLLATADQAAWTIESATGINDKGWILADGRKAGDLHSTVLLLKPVKPAAN